MANSFGPILHSLMLLSISELCTIFIFNLPTPALGYSYATDYFEVPLDHFSFAVNTTFKIRYLYNDSNWKQKENGPIFFYTGNEGDVESFANNTGFMWDIASEFGALLVFAEHRFYGQSFPEGFSYTFADNSIIGYLTVEQTLADFAKLLNWLKKSLNAESSPVISFGGSYGGQLTAYLRIKYPHIVQGGLASSAPLFLTEANCELHDKALKSVFKITSPECVTAIRKSWSSINRVTKSEEGKEWLTGMWKLCDPLVSDDNVTDLKSWLGSMYADIGMVNYPYPTNFLHDLPGYPVKLFCAKVTKTKVRGNGNGLDVDQLLLAKFLEGINMYFNNSGDLTCFDYADGDDTSAAFNSMDSQSFDFQSCTELIGPACDNGVDDFFEPSPWDFKQYTSDCQDEFGPGINPQREILQLFYGGKNILAASNIIFSNGVLDPWFGYGVLRNLSDSLLAIVIEDAAHHLDLRAEDPQDPPSVVAAREFEKKVIRQWISEYFEDQARLKKLINNFS